MNNFMEKQQYSSARYLIQKEWKRIAEPLKYRMLGSDSKEKQDASFNVLSENDKWILNLLNEAVRDVKLPYAKKIFFEHKELVDQSHSQKWLILDGRFMCYA